MCERGIFLHCTYTNTIPQGSKSEVRKIKIKRRTTKIKLNSACLSLFSVWHSNAFTIWNVSCSLPFFFSFHSSRILISLLIFLFVLSVSHMPVRFHYTIWRCSDSLAHGIFLLLFAIAIALYRQLFVSFLSTLYSLHTYIFSIFHSLSRPTTLASIFFLCAPCAYLAIPLLCNLYVKLSMYSRLSCRDIISKVLHWSHQNE